MTLVIKFTTAESSELKADFIYAEAKTIKHIFTLLTDAML